MRNRLFILLSVVAVALCSCSKTYILDPDTMTIYENAPLFDLFYTMDGEEKYFTLMPGDKVTRQFTMPEFGFYNDRDKVFARFSFEWKDNINLLLNSKHQYFVNTYAYPISESCNLEVHGWKAVSGTFSLELDNQHVYPNGDISYPSFCIRFNCIAKNAAGEKKEISNGRLLFKRNVVAKLPAKVFSHYIYSSPSK